MKYYINTNGKPWATESEVLPGSINDPLADIPEGIALWRLHYDLETKVLTIKYEGMTDSEAENQAHLDSIAQAQ